MHAGRRSAFLSLVLPASVVVATFLPDQAGEDAIQLLHTLELGIDERGGVGIGLYVLLEVGLVLDDIADEAVEEDDVGAGADAHVLIGHSRGAREAWIDMDHLR